MKTAGVMKRIALVMMVLALAVAMVACQGAVGKAGEDGEDGATGATGATGAQGPAGTSNNDPPTLKTPIMPVYLAINGTGRTVNKTIKLGSHYTDTETLILGFKATSSDPLVASVPAAITDGTLVITPKTPGMATITLSVYDGVNDPVPGMIEVRVVNSNAAPTIPSTPLSVADLADLAMLTYVSEGAVVRTVTIAATAGGAGTFDDVVTLTAEPGITGSTDDIATVAVSAGSKKDEWNVSITPLKGGSQSVSVTASDRFGAKAMPFMFTVKVNTVPTLRETKMPDATVSHLGAVKTKAYTIADHFATETDTTCTFSTSPAQPAGDRDANDSRMDDVVTVAAMARVSGDDVQSAVGANMMPLTVVTVDADASGPDLGTPAATSTLVAGTPTGTGSFDLTITCADDEDSVADTARITVVE
jgi:hypothetical protein